MNWMDDRNIQDIDLTSVDVGLQGGVIGQNQSPLTTQITDAGFQSYLQRAPIPVDVRSTLVLSLSSIQDIRMLSLDA